MPREVIDCVQLLARRSTTTLTFADRDGAIIPNDDNDNPDDNSNCAPNDDSDNVDDDDFADNEHGDNADNPDDTINPDTDIAGIYDGYDDANFDDNGDSNSDNPDQPPLAIPEANPNDDKIEGAKIERNSKRTNNRSKSETTTLARPARTTAIRTSRAETSGLFTPPLHP